MRSARQYSPLAHSCASVHTCPAVGHTADVTLNRQGSGEGEGWAAACPVITAATRAAVAAIRPAHGPSHSHVGDALVSADEGGRWQLRGRGRGAAGRTHLSPHTSQFDRAVVMIWIVRRTRPLPCCAGSIGGGGSAGSFNHTLHAAAHGATALAVLAVTAAVTGTLIAPGCIGLANRTPCAVPRLPAPDESGAVAWRGGAT